MNFNNMSPTAMTIEIIRRGETFEYPKGSKYVVVKLNEGNLKLLGKDVEVNILDNAGSVELQGMNIHCYIHKPRSGSSATISASAKYCIIKERTASPWYNQNINLFTRQQPVRNNYTNPNNGWGISQMLHPDNNPLLVGLNQTSNGEQIFNPVTDMPGGSYKSSEQGNPEIRKSQENIVNKPSSIVISQKSLDNSNKSSQGTAFKPSGD